MNRNSKIIMALLLFFFVLVPIGRWYGEMKREQNSNSTSPAQQGFSKQTADRNKVIVSTQSAEGLTNEAFNYEIFEKIEKHMVERMSVLTKQVYEKNGDFKSKPNITAESVLLKSNGKNISITRLKDNGINYGVAIQGVVGNEFIRILCLSDNGQEIKVSYGECATEIFNVFGVKLDSVN